MASNVIKILVRVFIPRTAAGPRSTKGIKATFLGRRNKVGSFRSSCWNALNGHLLEHWNTPTCPMGAAPASSYLVVGKVISVTSEEGVSWPRLLVRGYPLTRECRFSSTQIVRLVNHVLLSKTVFPSPSHSLVQYALYQKQNIKSGTTHVSVREKKCLAPRAPIPTIP